MNRKIDIQFFLNGREIEDAVEPNMVLADFLRLRAGLRGTKKGCGKGECGSCTVLLDGRAVNSCLVLTPQVDGKEVITIEGMGDTGDLHPLQTSFMEHGASQCGFCTPGMLLSAKGLLDENPSPSEQEVRKALSGNLCRCSGYQKITEAILDGAEKIRR
jgi:carbon-monoxide dehydrogenase small subunit